MKELTIKHLYLAWQMGKLNQDEEFIDAILFMDEDEVKEHIRNNGELIDWE